MDRCIPLEFLNRCFDYCLAVDEVENILWVSPSLAEDAAIQMGKDAPQALEDLLSSLSLLECRRAMRDALEGARGEALFAISKRGFGFSTLFNVVFGQSVDDRIFLFFNTSRRVPTHKLEHDFLERGKELNTIFAVGRWIDESVTVDEFFTEFPMIAVQGLQWPEKAACHISFKEHDYGQRPVGENAFCQEIVVNDVRKGVFEIGYTDPSLQVLEGERNMARELLRMATKALERREFADNLSVTEMQFKLSQEKVDELEKQVASKTREARSLEDKLKTINSYVDQTKKHYEQSKARLDTIFKALPDTVGIIDYEFNLIETNSEEQKEGEKCYKAFYGREKPCVGCKAKWVIANSAPASTEIQSEGNYYQVQTLPIFDEENKVQALVEFQRDITREKMIELQLQQADKLASLGQLVSGVGHEINNPNQFIKGNIGIIRQAFEDILPIMDEYARETEGFKVAKLPYDFFRQHIEVLVDDIAGGSLRIQEIVKGLKNFARKDEGLLIDKVDLNNIINEAVRLVHKQVHKSCEVHTEFLKDLPEIVGNSQKLEQVMINLIINASQAMKDEGRGNIWVSTAKEDDPKGRGDVIVVSVKDDGIGMDDKTLKQIYDPFFTTKRGKGGTGLGLSIVFQIIQEHGGVVDVNSELGEGTTFTMRLPAFAKGKGE